jgi:hypothetical protein
MKKLPPGSISFCERLGNGARFGGFFQGIKNRSTLRRAVQKPNENNLPTVLFHSPFASESEFFILLGLYVYTSAGHKRFYFLQI